MPTIDSFINISFSDTCRSSNTITYNLVKHARHVSA